MSYNFEQQTLFFLIYGFLVWAAKAIFFAIRKKAFINRGLLSLPIDFEIGVVFFNISIVWPALERNYVGMAAQGSGRFHDRRRRE